MLLRMARFPLVTFLVVLGGIVALDRVLDGHVRTGPAVFGAVGGLVGAAIANRLRQPRDT